MAWNDFLKAIFGEKKANNAATTHVAPRPSPWAKQMSGAAQDVEPTLNALKSKETSTSGGTLEIRRHFYNEAGFQTYGSFFSHWGGWITAGHVLTEASDLLPDFASGEAFSWPDGLDAAVIGCALPPHAPAPPRTGQDVIIKGYPAGSRHQEVRRGTVYYERGAGTWIAHIKTPDEPVVTGMSGGPVIDASSGAPIGILITRNSPADLNSDRDPDESADFIALSDVWHAVSKQSLIS